MIKNELKFTTILLLSVHNLELILREHILYHLFVDGILIYCFYQFIELIYLKNEASDFVCYFQWANLILFVLFFKKLS